MTDLTPADQDAVDASLENVNSKFAPTLRKVHEKELARLRAYRPRLVAELAATDRGIAMRTAALARLDELEGTR